MHLHVQNTTRLQGTIAPPSSKSQSIRGIIFGLLSGGTTHLINPLDSVDIQDAIKVCGDLGAVISNNNNSLIINSTGHPLPSQETTIHTGNSGITTCFILPILGLRQNCDVPIRVDCGEQMQKRPISPLVNALRALGLSIKYENNEGRLPIIIQGKLTGGIAEVDGLSSQFISALLIAAPCASTNSILRVKNLHERPYMNMTLNWLQLYNMKYSHEQTETEDIFHIEGNQNYPPLKTVISGDFSSASYLLAAAALIPGRVVVTGLNMQDPQGDKRLISILQTMGADIAITSEGVVVEGGLPLKGISIDANEIPDLLPTLAVIGTFASGKTVIKNVPQARVKETDRIHSMTTGLRQLGANIEEYPDGMMIYQSKLRGANVKGYGDHRTVMALAIAGLIAEGETIIDESESINKTFPTFVELMQSLGATMQESK